MRVLISATHQETALANVYRRFLVENACEIIPTYYPETVNLGSGNFIGKIIRRIAPSYAYREANRQLLKDVDDHKPDVVWIFKGMELFPATIEQIHNRGIMTINYNADHPLQYFSRGTGNANVANSIRHYDMHLTYSKLIEDQFRAQFPAIEIHTIPFGHEIDKAEFDKIADVVETKRACFLGNPDAHRRAHIMALVEAGIAVDVYGHDWNGFLKPGEKLNLSGPVTGHEMAKILREYRVQLNFFRPHNENSHNMRSFEVPACGGIMLAPDSDEHRSFFEMNKEAFYFKTKAEMIELAKHVLALPDAEAEKIREAARHRSEQGKYHYRFRALAAYDAIEEKFKNQ